MSNHDLFLWTRRLDSDEMRELFEFMGSLKPAYELRDGDSQEKIRKGGRLMIKFRPQHWREAVYFKIAWGGEPDYH